MNNAKDLEFLDTVQFVENVVKQTITSIFYTRHSFKTRRGGWLFNAQKLTQRVKENKETKVYVPTKTFY